MCSDGPLLEACETWEDVLDTIDQGLAAYKQYFHRPITREDLAQPNELRCTPLMYLAEHGKLDLTQHLLETVKEKP